MASHTLGRWAALTGHRASYSEGLQPSRQGPRAALPTPFWMGPGSRAPTGWWGGGRPRGHPEQKALGVVPCPASALGAAPRCPEVCAGMSFVCASVYLAKGWVRDLESKPV